MLKGCGFSVKRRDGKPVIDDDGAELVQLRRRLGPDTEGPSAGTQDPKDDD